MIRTIDLGVGDMVATFLEDRQRWFRSPFSDDLRHAAHDTLCPAVVVRSEDVKKHVGTEDEYHLRELTMICADGSTFNFFAMEDHWAYLIKRKPTCHG
jgi:hypothetical protein